MNRKQVNLWYLRKGNFNVRILLPWDLMKTSGPIDLILCEKVKTTMMKTSRMNVGEKTLHKITMRLGECV